MLLIVLLLCDKIIIYVVCVIQRWTSSYRVIVHPVKAMAENVVSLQSAPKLSTFGTFLYTIIYSF